MFWQIVWFLRIKGGVTGIQLLCGKISSFYLCRIKISPVKITLWTVWGLTFWYRWGCRYQISAIVTEQQTTLVWDSSPPVACVTLGTGISCSSKTTLEPRHLKQDLVSFNDLFCRDFMSDQGSPFSCYIGGTWEQFHFLFREMDAIHFILIQEVLDLKLNIPVETFHVAI